MRTSNSTSSIVAYTPVNHVDNGIALVANAIRGVAACPPPLSDNALASNKAVARQVAAAECHNRCGAYQNEHERLPVLG